jgi:hypothetical protein
LFLFSLTSSWQPTANGQVVFTVQAGVPSTLFYQCEVHSAMTGRITLNAGSGAAATAAMSLVLVLLAALLL